MKKLYTKLLERKTLVTREHEYEKAIKCLLEVKQQVEEVLTGEQLVSVKDSYEKTLAYGVSAVDELWPLVTVVSQLRHTIKTMNEMLKNCVAQREACIKESEKDARYEKIVGGCNSLVVKIKKEFPFDLFEKRIQQIFSSQEYQEQGKLLEKKKLHEETMNILRGMKKSLEDALSTISSKISDINRCVSSLKSDISKIKTKVTSLRNNTTGRYGR